LIRGGRRGTCPEDMRPALPESSKLSPFIKGGVDEPAALLQ
jgi:hypothetical protein